MKRLPILTLFFFLGSLPGIPATAGDLITSREAGRNLPLPKGDDVFHFVVYGDRTGGPPEGIEILEEAVANTNLLDPDLVMTVGDLVQGLCPPDVWMEQMREYRGVMKGLDMPWYPVAGNHDVYWSRRDEDPPPGEFEGHFEKHFGPLWYAFRHKNAGFVVLYTDEGDPEQGPKAFRKPEQSQMSQRQMKWLRKTLGKLSGLDHVFVFLHHPRWMKERYPDNNWPKVHDILARTGNVSAVFAGHIHYLHYAGEMDGIDYFSMGATGSSVAGGIEDAELGFLHHLTAVTVREESVSVSAMPVGSVMDPKRFDARRQEDLHALAREIRGLSMPTLALDEGDDHGGAAVLTLDNPASRPVEVTIRPAFDAESWHLSPDHRHVKVDAGESKKLTFEWVHLPGRPHEPVPEAVFEMDYLADGYRLSLPEHRRAFEVEAPEKAK